MSLGIDFNSSAKNFLATISIAAAMALMPLRDAFAQKVGDTYTVAELKEVIYKGKNQEPALPYRQTQISTQSTRGNLINVYSEHLVVVSADGLLGFTLKGDGSDLKTSNHYTVSEKFSKVRAFKDITSVEQLPKLIISNVAKEKRKKGAAQLFNDGYQLTLTGECTDEVGKHLGYNEYYTRNDNEGGSMMVVKIQGDKVALIQIADKYIELPVLKSLRDKP